jgi:hypothetical protein
VTTTDGAGNVGQPTTINFVIDTTPPVISPSGPIYDAYLKGTANGTTPSFGGGATTVGVDAFDIASNPTSASPTAGVVSLELKIDGSDPNPATDLLTQSCSAGSCDMSVDLPVNTSTLSAGAHTFTIVAIDQAGNSTTSSFTVTITPSEPIQSGPTPQQAPSTSTLGMTLSEIVSTTLANTLSPALLAASTTAQYATQTLQPALGTLSGAAGYVGLGTLVPTEIGPTAADGITIDTRWGGLSVVPTGSPTTDPGAIMNGDAIDFAGTTGGTDTIIRPTPLGAETFLQLQSLLAPTSYSWTVAMPGGQVLDQLPNGSVAVLENTADSLTGDDVDEQPLGGGPWPGNPQPAAASPPQAIPYTSSAASNADPNAHSDSQAANNTQTNLTNEQNEISYAQANTPDGGQDLLAVITAPWAVDALGTPVPTHLSVNGDVITLNIDTSTGGPYVYPIYADPHMDSEEATSECSPTHLCVQQENNYAQHYGQITAAHKAQNNNMYENFSADNCTNFISQVLKAGGMTMHISVGAGDGENLDPNAWYYTAGLTEPAYSYSWVVANDFFHYFIMHHFATVAAHGVTPGSIDLENKAEAVTGVGAHWQDGDVAAWIWKYPSGSNPVAPTLAGPIDHVQFVSGLNAADDGDPWVFQQGYYWQHEYSPGVYNDLKYNETNKQGRDYPGSLLIQLHFNGVG